MSDANRLCKNCTYFEARAGECRRYAPRPVFLEEQKKVRWPASAPIAWCGEFSAKE